MPDLAGTIASRLDEAARRVDYEFELRDAVSAWQEDGSLSAEAAECLRQIFGYSLVAFDQEDRRSANGGPFAPLYSFADGEQWPPPLSALPDGCLALVATIAASATDPMVVARISDVLWERRVEGAHLFARQAATAYLRFGDRPARTHLDMIRIQMADRALEIASRLNDEPLLRESAGVLLTVAGESIEGDDPAIGPVARASRALMRLPASMLPRVELDAILVRAIDVLGADASAVESLLGYRIELAADTDARHLLEREQIDRLVTAAESAPHVFLRHAHLERANELLHRRNGSREERQRIARLIEEAPVNSEDFERVSAELELPAGEIEDLVAPAAALPSWQEALDWFGAPGPATGNPADNLAQVEQQRREYPVQFLFGTVLYGPGGVPLLHAQTEEERLRYAVAMNESFALQMSGEIYRRALDQLVARADFPDLAELTYFFIADGINEQVADAVARAFLHFRAGAFDEAAHVLTPRIEAIVRSLAGSIGLATIYPPRGAAIGGYVSLGELFRRLEPVGLPDEAWRRYGEHLLCDPMGANLRNEIAHGLKSRIVAREAALLIHFACHLRRIRLTDPASAEPTGDDPGG
jgi:hypothetical protein